MAAPAHLLDALAEHLADAGVALYSSSAPLPSPSSDAEPVVSLGDYAHPGPVVILTPYAGPEADTRNGVEFPRLQLVARHRSLVAALALEDAAHTALHLAAIGLPLPHSRQLTDCYALASAPTPLGADERGQQEVSRSYQLTTELA